MEIGMELEILYEDAQILVCIKPSGIPSQSDRTSDYDMVNRLKNYVFEKSGWQGQPYIEAVHRLDRPVGGIMVFAKTPFAASSLGRQIQRREFCKKYLAVVTANLEGEIGKEKQLLSDYLVRNGKTNLSSITTKEDARGKKAELFYKVRDVKGDLSFVEVELLTGRHHQIRVQLKERLGGIYGDAKYNSSAAENLKNGERSQIALFAYHLEFWHPKAKRHMVFEKMPDREPFSQFLLS